MLLSSTINLKKYNLFLKLKKTTEKNVKIPPDNDELLYFILNLISWKLFHDLKIQKDIKNNSQKKKLLIQLEIIIILLK